MASLLFKEKKGVNFSCVSPASAAICTSIDPRSMVQPSTGRAIDRHTPHLRDPTRRAKPLVCSMSSHQPLTKQPNKKRNLYYYYHHHHHQRKSSDGRASSGASSPPGSARYLLDGEDDGGVWAVDGDDGGYSNLLPDPVVEQPPLPPLLSLEPPTLGALMREEPATNKPFATSAAASRTQHQVVILRVSLHCKGCEGKVRKHISKMEGVTSFDIDFARKKVTVVGEVTPLGVLSSISKVKHAQFWPSLSPPRASDSLF